MAATSGRLDEVELEWDRRVALGVVMAAAGYPLNPRKGDAISGLPADAEDAMVFHAGTKAAEGAIVELSAHLAGFDRRLTENWLYQWINAK